MNFSEEFKERSTELMRRTKRLGDALYHEGQGLVCRLALPPENNHRRGYDVAQTSVWYCNALAWLLELGEAGEADRIRLNRILSRVVDHQMLDTEDRWYGNYRWYVHWEKVEDRNAVSFIVPEMGQVFIRHRALLEDEVAGRIAESLALAVNALDSHPAPWRYTNIFLLNILSRLTVAAALDDEKQYAEARARWQEWFEKTDQTGIMEYNSPTYSATHVVPLGRMLLYARDDEFRKQIETVLEHLYLDLCLHWHAPTNLLAGAKSRAYPLDGLGISLMRHVMFQQIGAPLATFAHAGTGFSALNPYEIPDELKALALDPAPDREVHAAIPELGLKRATYLGPEFALGAKSGRNYGKQELCIYLACKTYNQPGILFRAELHSTIEQFADLKREHLLAVWPIDATPEYEGSPHVWMRGHLGRFANFHSITVDGHAWEKGQVSPIKHGSEMLLSLRTVKRAEDIYRELFDPESESETGLFVSARFGLVSSGKDTPDAAGYLWHDPMADQVYLDLIAHGPSIMGIALKVSPSGPVEAPALSASPDGRSWSSPGAGLEVDLDAQNTQPEDYLLKSGAHIWSPGDWAPMASG